jgi:hypothetical protein
MRKIGLVAERPEALNLARTEPLGIPTPRVFHLSDISVNSVYGCISRYAAPLEHILSVPRLRRFLARGRETCSLA